MFIPQNHPFDCHWLEPLSVSAESPSIEYSNSATQLIIYGDGHIGQKYSKGIDYFFFYDGRFELLVSNNACVVNPVSTEQKDVSGMPSEVRGLKKSYFCYG